MIMTLPNVAKRLLPPGGMPMPSDTGSSDTESSDTGPSYIQPANAGPAVTDLQQRQLEEQLATIITSARSVAVAAEELLREVSQAGAEGSGRSAPHAIAVAPRLLAATEQQLLSVMAMLRRS
jgi:hypothetical protein